MRGHTSHTPLLCSEVAVQCSQEMKFQRINKDNRAFCSRVSSLQAKQIETALVDSDGYHLSSLAGCSGDSAGLRFQRSGRLLGNVLSAAACNCEQFEASLLDRGCRPCLHEAERVSAIRCSCKD